jgi:hypothetical protein
VLALVILGLLGCSKAPDDGVTPLKAQLSPYPRIQSLDTAPCSIDPWCLCIYA